MNAEPLRVVVAGGGTGGHLFPGIAVVRELLSRRPETVATFAGTAQGIEAKVVPREGFELDVIRSSGLKGKSVGGLVRGMGRVPLGLGDAWGIVSRRRPHLVIGVGGYSSGPVVLVAAMRGVPTMLLEQNAVPGLTNRTLARFVRAAAVTFDSTVSYFGGKAFVSGNPVRSEFVEIGRQSTHARAHDDDAGFRVLVFGGSQGAHAINLAMVEAASTLARQGGRLRLTHQTGARDVEMVRAAYRDAGLQADVEPFLFDMGRRIGEADLIVCRGGATTLAEITAAARPALVIPLPTATDDHQRKNAEALASAGAAEVLVQSEASGERLAARIQALAADAPARQRMSDAARRFAKPDAAKVIVDKALTLVGGERSEVRGAR